MNASGQRRLVLVGSLSITALLVGSVVGGLGVWRTLNERLQNPDFLKRQLELVDADGDQGNAGAPREMALVRVSVGQRKAIHPERAIIGRLVEVHKVTVASEVTGQIVDMPVEEGTSVVGGQTVLARVDDVWCRLAQKRSLAQVASIEAKLKFAQLELARLGELSGSRAVSRAVSQSELESTQSTVAELKASLDETQAALEEQTERIARSVIVAPFDGVVVARHAESGGHVTLGTPIVDVVSRGEVDARLMVPESMVNLVRVGQDLAIQIDPLGEEVRGKVVSLTPYGPTASRTFPVRVRLDDQQGRLKVGMSVTALIPMGLEREALVVSRDAVLVRPDGSTVWVALPAGRGQTAEVQPVPVTITARMQDEYAVEPETDQGRQLLTAGTEVVVEGAERLLPGQQVRIVALDAAPAGMAGPVAAVQEGQATAPAKGASGAASP